MSKFYLCKKCGNLIGLIEDGGKPISCCGEIMEKLEAQVTEAGGYEKHIPDVKIEGDVVKVQVGSVPHVMLEGHYISWIFLETEKGGQRKVCKDTPTAEFKVINDEPVAVYEYCNLHGLWKKEL